MKVTAHAFVAGPPDTYLAIYCQAPPEAGTEPVPGHPGRTCGHLESAHTMTAEQQVESDATLGDRLAREIGGWA